MAHPQCQPFPSQVKTANGVPYAAREQVKLDAARLLVQAPVLMAMLGAGTRGVLGLRDMFTAPRLPKPSLIGATQFLPMPRIKDDEQQKLGNAQPGFLQRMTDPVAKLIYDTLLKTGPNESNLFAGDGAKTVMGVPLVGAALPLAMAGGYAGYRATDSLFDNRRKQDQKADLHAIKSQYMDALRGKFAAADDVNLHQALEDTFQHYYDAQQPRELTADELMAKGHGTKQYKCGHTQTCRCRHGGELPVQNIDEPCYDCREKTAAAPSDSFVKTAEAVLEKIANPLADPSVMAPEHPLNGIPGLPLGEYAGNYGALALMTALGAGLGTGMLTYNRASKNSRRKTIEEALLRHYNRGQQQQPIYAYTA